MSSAIQLSNEPTTVNWPASHFVFVERVGNFRENAPKAWKSAESLMAKVAEHNQITGAAALYKAGQEIYRAGFLLAAEPANLPADMQYQKLNAGKYARFVMTGPYDQLPEATRRTFEMISEEKIALRDDFNIEHYITDPRTTPQEQSITEILFPMA